MVIEADHQEKGKRNKKNNKFRHPINHTNLDFNQLNKNNKITAYAGQINFKKCKNYSNTTNLNFLNQSDKYDIDTNSEFLNLNQENYYFQQSFVRLRRIDFGVGRAAASGAAAASVPIGQPVNARATSRQESQDIISPLDKKPYQSKNKWNLCAVDEMIEKDQETLVKCEHLSESIAAF